MKITVWEDCADCRGTGWYADGGGSEFQCLLCGGEGAIPRNVTLQEFAAMIDVIRIGEIAVKDEATR